LGIARGSWAQFSKSLYLLPICSVCVCVCVCVCNRGSGWRAYRRAKSGKQVSGNPIPRSGHQHRRCFLSLPLPLSFFSFSLSLSLSLSSSCLAVCLSLFRFPLLEKRGVKAEQQLYTISFFSLFFLDSLETHLYLNVQEETVLSDNRNNI